MSEGHFRHLPVVDAAGNLVGMLSMRDLVRAGVLADSKRG
jgi:CBS domain-containing protein